MHRTNATGQLRPMNERMTPAQLKHRYEKRGYRLGLMHHIGATRQMAEASARALFMRGFFGRLKLVLLGR